MTFAQASPTPQSLTPASYLAHSRANTPLLGSTGDLEPEQVVSHKDTNDTEGTSTRPLHATCRRKKRPSSGEFTPSRCADCDDMLTEKAESISCDGPGCDQRVRAKSESPVNLSDLSLTMPAVSPCLSGFA